MSRAANIRQMFSEELETFAAAFPNGAFPIVIVRLEFRKRHFLPKPQARDLAWYEPDNRIICIVRRAIGAHTMSCLRGIVRHELGHAVDHALGFIDQPRAERRADIHAGHATGTPVHYTKDGVQHASRGVAVRPAWLPK